jgi:hypothetical protein
LLKFSKMTLSETQIQAILKAHQQIPEYILKARVYYKDLRSLIKGKDFDQLLVKIENIEHSDRAKARKLYARSIKDLNARLLRHLDNVYSAAGGSKEYKTEDKDFLLYLSDISSNKSLESWLKTFWIEDLYHTDPNGVVFLESKEDKIYPTYKAITSIRGYEADGQLLKWILFEPYRTKASILKAKYSVELEGINLPEELDIWRIVDGEKDCLYYLSGEDFKEIPELTFPILTGTCPGVINSDIIDIECGIRLSPIDPIIELQKEFARDQSFKSIYKVIKANPLFWRYGIMCPACHGTGKTGEGKCTQCDGSGKIRRRDVTDEVIIPLPESTTQPIVPQPIAGFISPDLEVWTKYDSELKLLEDLMNNTHWGSIFQTGTNETATGRFIDTQPVINRLNKYSDVAEWMEKVITEMVANYKIASKPKDESVCIISYGRRFIIESPDTILEKYQTAKEKNTPVTVLDRLLSEYLTSKYKNDPENLRLMLIKKEIEPYVHYTLQEVKDNFSIIEAQRKIIFCDWWETLNKAQITSVDVETLKQKFKDYSDKIISEPAQPGTNNPTV